MENETNQALCYFMLSIPFAAMLFWNIDSDEWFIKIVVLALEALLFLKAFCIL